MRVYDRNLTSGTAAGSAVSQEAQKLDCEGEARAASLGADGGGDRVEHSSSLERLSRAISGDRSERANRVQSLAAQYQRGGYRPDSLAISRGMVAEAEAAEMLDRSTAAAAQVAGELGGSPDQLPQARANPPAHAGPASEWPTASWWRWLRRWQWRARTAQENTDSLA